MCANTKIIDISKRKPGTWALSDFCCKTASSFCGSCCFFLFACHWGSAEFAVSNELSCTQAYGNNFCARECRADSISSRQVSVLSMQLQMPRSFNKCNAFQILNLSSVILRCLSKWKNRNGFVNRIIFHFVQNGNQLTVMTFTRICTLCFSEMFSRNVFLVVN